MSSTLSIIIVNWNSKDYLRKCLESIESTCVSLSPKVIVVDGASFDGCGEMLVTNFPRVTFLQSPENIGFGRCNNLGFTKVTTDSVLLLNPDTELQNGAVARLLDVLDETPNAAVVAPRLLNSDGTLQTSCVQSLPTPLNQALDCEFLRNSFPSSRLWGTAKAFSSKHPITVDVVSGACMALRSSTFRKLDGFREEFFMYGEDVDLCFRAQRTGLINMFVPDAEVVHHGGCSSQSQVSGFSATMQRAALERYFHLNCSRTSATGYRVLQAISALTRLALLAFPRIFSPRAGRDRAWLSMHKWMMVLKWAACQKLPMTSQRRRVTESVVSPEAVAFPEHPARAK